MLADNFDATSVLFSDFVGFTKWCATVQPAVVFATLEVYFSLFDALARKLGIFKVAPSPMRFVFQPGLPS